MLRRVNHSLDFYLRRLHSGEPFTFVRYGDGEWSSVLDKRREPKANCDGHTFFPGMHRDFVEIFQQLRDRPPPEDRYFMGMQNMVMGMWGAKIEQFLEQHGLADREWHNADVFHRASQRGRMPELFDALNRWPLVLVGPTYLHALKPRLNYNEFVPVPRRNCYLQLPVILQKTSAALSRTTRPAVVAVVASMPAEILLHRLYDKYGEDSFLCDFGSVFDPYVGKRSRRYHNWVKPDTSRRSR